MTAAVFTGVFWVGVLGVVLVITVLATSGRRSGAGASTGEQRRSPPPGGTDAGQVGPPVLASDAERARTADRLAAAMAEGRIALDEGRERIGAAYEARDRRQLSSLVADVPAPPEPAARAAGSASSAGRVIAVVAVVAAAAAQAVLGAWELWPVAVGTLVLFPFGTHRR